MTKNIETLNFLIKNAAHPSRRDNSLLMRRIRRNKDFDLANSDLSPEKLTKVLYNCKPGKYRLVNSDLNNDEQNNQAYKIKQIRKTSNRRLEETGLSPLAIGFPFFEGWLSDWYRGPLLLIPAEIKINNSNNLNNWSVVIDENAEVSINLTFLITLQQERGMNFNPEEVPNWEVKDINEKPEKFWEDVKSYFPNNIITNWKILENKILEIPEVTREDNPSKNNYEKDLELKPFAVLGHFPQGKNSIVNDLSKIKKLVDENKLPDTVKHVLGNNNENTFSEVLDERVKNVDNYSEEEILKILPADVSQEKVLLQSKKSKSLVVQGPPGTGKSQTIVNLIGDSLNENEKVLLVCEKRVALEVVYDMLKDLGLDFLSVIVGGSGSSKHESEKHVYNTLRQIAQTAKKTDNTNLQKNNEKVDESVKRLNKVHHLLNKSVVDDDSSLTLEKLYKTTEQVSIDVLNKLNSFKEVQTSKELDKRLDKINNFLDLKSEISDDSVWKNRKPGILADKNLKNEELMKKTKILARSQKIAPLYKNLDEKNYQQLMDIENDFQSINKYNLDILSDMKNNSFRFLSPEWLKIRSKIIFAKHKINKEYSKIEKELKSLKELFKEEYINNYLIKLRNGESIKDFADSLYQDWESDKHFLERINKMYSESDDEFAKDLQKLGEISRNSKEAADLYERTVKTNWIKKKHQEYPELNYFMNNRYQELKKMLQSNLNSKLKKGKEHLRNKYKKIQKKKLSTDKGQRIVKISNRQRKLPSLRKLLNDYEDIILQILPVWLASPAQVARLFELGTKFDHVIFDEASQIPLENAMSGLIRGKRVTVVGDKNQMPPTRLFYRTISNEESDNLSEDDRTSLLDAADDVWPDKMLKYHYRSKYPELIEFSNKSFYDGQLMIAPVNKANDFGDKAINWHQVDGNWDNQKNHIEAEAVIEFLLNNLPETEVKVDKTLWGIVTFNQKQADLLIDSLQKKLEEKRNDEDLTEVEKEIWEWCMGSINTTKYIWIKNLENVQGDEVQKMIISVAYAVDKEMDRVANRFGLLNQEGGDKRLNVAITRAQEKIDVFCSFDPDTDLEVSSTTGRGPKLFKQYLRFAKYIGEGKKEEAIKILDSFNDIYDFETKGYSLHDYDSPFEQEVAQAIRNRGYEVHTQIGSYGYSIDLGIVDPENKNKYLFGIECDGATYHHTQSAKERDVNRQKFLEDKGWRIERIWSRRWWEQPEKVLDELEEKIDKIIANKEDEDENLSEEINFYEDKKDEVDYLMEDINYNETFEPLTRRILNLMLEEKRAFKNLELQDELNFKDSRAIRKTLKPLLKERVVFKKGKGSGTKYYLNKNYY